MTTSGLAAVAWARFQPRTVALAEAFAGEALFVSSRLSGHPALLPARYLAAAARTWLLLERRQPRRVVVITPPVFAPLVAWVWIGGVVVFLGTLLALVPSRVEREMAQIREGQEETVGVSDQELEAGDSV